WLFSQQDLQGGANLGDRQRVQHAFDPDARHRSVYRNRNVATLLSLCCVLRRYHSKPISPLSVAARENTSYIGVTSLPLCRRLMMTSSPNATTTRMTDSA